MQYTTLVYLVTDDAVCLGQHMRGRGLGYWNGFGGKLEKGENPKVAAARELKEECMVTVEPASLTQVAELTFVYPDDTVVVHVFEARVWEGVPTPTDEMRPGWFSFENVPYEHMWEDDQYWLKRALQGEKLVGCFIFDATGKKIVEMEVGAVDFFDRG